MIISRDSPALYVESRELYHEIRIAALELEGELKCICVRISRDSGNICVPVFQEPSETTACLCS